MNDLKIKFNYAGIGELLRDKKLLDHIRSVGNTQGTVKRVYIGFDRAHVVVKRSGK